MTRMTLSAVKSGRLKRPKRVLLYGCHGVGKSTFAAGASAPVFIGEKDGTAQLDVERFPEPDSWVEILEAIEVLIGDDHGHKTVVLDTLDWMEPLCWEHVCKAANEPSIEAIGGGYGKGYTAALDAWRLLLARLDRLRDRRGLDVVLLSHCHIRTFRNPQGDDFDRYELKLNGKAAGLCKEWCDAVLFAQYETLTNTDRSKRVRGVSTGARYIHTERRAAYDAKNRYGLPERLPLSWVDFVSSIGNPNASSELLVRIAEARQGLDDRHQDRIAAGIKKAGHNPERLSKILDWITAQIEITNPENTNA